MVWWGWLAVGAVLMMVQFTISLIQKPMPVNYPVQGYAFAALWGGLIYGCPLLLLAWLFDW